MLLAAPSNVRDAERTPTPHTRASLAPQPLSNLRLLAQQQNDGLGGDRAVLPQRVHLLVRLGLDVHHRGVAAQQLGQVRADGLLVRTELGALRDNRAI